ncbi:MAG: hypothetical protein KDB86_06740 [Actinobacteria bacterium]|nr:hypothetical protein [Actinomycetota bacterium]MCB9389759.1 hypothetical protein [Acidimicrobiia bacterium]
MKGKWAHGLEPRGFRWVITDRLAASERPGGYGRNHRRVRRDEEIQWLVQQQFTLVLSLLPSPHNLKAYRDRALRYKRIEIGPPADRPRHLQAIFLTLRQWLSETDERILIHHETVDDELCGAIAGYLLWAGYLEKPSHAIIAVEQLMGRQLGSLGRNVVALSAEIPTEAPESFDVSDVIVDDDLSAVLDDDVELLLPDA